MNPTSSLKALSTAQMLDLSQRCLHARRAQFDAISETRGSMSLLERAHRNLEKASTQNPEQAEALRRLTLKLSELDLHHDRHVRALYHLLSGLGEALDDEELAASYAALREKVLPSGLNTTLMRYEDQIQASKQARRELHATERELLSRAVLPGGQGTLLDLAQTWWQSAEALDEVWQRRNTLRKEHGGELTTAGDLLRARHQWIGAMRVLAAALHASSLSPEARTALLPELQQIG